MKWKLARDALIVTIFVLFGVWFAFGQDRFDFAGATNCSCKIDPVVHNLGNLKPNIHLVFVMRGAVALYYRKITRLELRVDFWKHYSPTEAKVG